MPECGSREKKIRGKNTSAGAWRICSTGWTNFIQHMGMAYSKAWRIVKQAEEALGLQLLFRMRKNGSRLTAEGRTMLGAYEEAEQAAWEAADAVMEKYFGGGADGKDPGNTAPA